MRKTLYSKSHFITKFNQSLLFYQLHHLGINPEQFKTGEIRLLKYSVFMWLDNQKSLLCVQRETLHFTLIGVK